MMNSFKIRCGNQDGKTEPSDYLAGLIYLDVQIGDDSVSGWVRPEVSRIIKAAFNKPGEVTAAPADQRALFAAMAMQGLAASSAYSNHMFGHTAMHAVQMADALLAELSK